VGGRRGKGRRELGEGRGGEGRGGEEIDSYYFAALNLMLCYYAISDREKLKKTFQRTLHIATGVEDEDRYYPTVVSQGGSGVYINCCY
jgi:hypothetical protein